MASPEISVVLVTPDRFRSLRQTIRCLRAQTARERLELIVVGPTQEALDDHEAWETAGFAGVRTVPVGPIPNVDHALAHGVRAASAPVVALLEDHAFPESGWAEALIAAHRGPWTAVAPAMANANPARALSWTNLLLAYGAWLEPVAAGEVRLVPLHNVSVARSALDEMGPELERAFGREGALLPHLRAGGHRFGQEPAARVAHVNPSRLRPTVELRLNSGRLAGATRVRTEGWSAARRAVYVLTSPLIPAVRLWRLRVQIQHARLAPRILPALVLGLVLDAVGQALGYARGPGDTAAARLATFEMDRLRHVTRRDREALLR